MTYGMWGALMDGPGGAGALDRSEGPIRAAKAPCPKMVGEWEIEQESEITGDERVKRASVLTFKAKLSMAQVRWNFLRSQ